MSFIRSYNSPSIVTMPTYVGMALFEAGREYL
jgi:hypothetical protein